MDEASSPCKLRMSFGQLVSHEPGVSPQLGVLLRRILA